MNSIPVASAPSVSRNKSKLTSEFVSASDKKEHQCSFDVVISKKMINGKETTIGSIRKWGPYGYNKMDEEFTNAKQFAKMVSDKVVTAFEQL